MRINRIHFISFSVIIALLLTLTMVTAACNSTTTTPNTKASPPSLVSLALSCPSNIAVGTKQNIVAMGTYSDGSTSDVSSVATWLSSNNAVATISGGVLTALAVGNTNVTASLTGVTSPAVSLTITSK